MIQFSCLLYRDAFACIIAFRSLKLSHNKNTNQTIRKCKTNKKKTILNFEKMKKQRDFDEIYTKCKNQSIIDRIINV